MNFVIDIGNARIKWARVMRGRPAGSGAALHANGLDAALAALSAAVPREAGRVLVANVAAEPVAAGVRSVVTAVTGVEPEFVKTSTESVGVRCGYDDPSRLGVDRWVALLAARAGVDGAVCVVSAGTAVTFDALAPDGRHLGGLIFAGPRISADALLKNTRFIGPTAGRTSRVGDSQLLGHSTDEAVSHAGWLAVAAGIDRAVAVVARVVGEAPRVLMAGGDAETLTDWLETAVELRADLVLEGLALLSDQR
jgi:type III pantothenate kinase